MFGKDFKFHGQILTIQVFNDGGLVSCARSWQF